MKKLLLIISLLSIAQAQALTQADELMFDAIKKDSDAELYDAITQGAWINVQDEQGMTVLHWAVKKSNSEVVFKLLMMEYADTDIQDLYGRTPLHIAAKKGKAEIVEALVNNGANIDIKDAAGKTAEDLAPESVPSYLFITPFIVGSIEWEAEKGSIESVTEILNQYQSSDKRKFLIGKAINRAAYHNHIKLLEFLYDSEGLNEHALPLLYAVEVETIQWVLSHGADVTKGCPLIAVISNGTTIKGYGNGGYSITQTSTYDKLKLLLEHGANVNETNGSTTPLHVALTNSKFEYEGYYSNTPLEDGSLLTWNEVEKQLEEEAQRLVSLLLSYGADINAKNEYGETPLFYAKYSSIYGETPLFYAKYISILDYLINHGASLYAQDNKGHTAFMYAMRDPNYHVAKLLLKKEGELNDQSTGNTPKRLVDLKDYKGRTPLMLAIKDDYMKGAKLCLKYGAKIDEQDPTGKTALHYAAENGCLEELEEVD